MEGDFRLASWLIQPQLNTITGPSRAPVLLEPKVMEVLVYLADRAGEVVPKERLLHALWPDTYVTENALTAAVSDLRRVFDDDAKNPKFIQTISKRGYRLIAPVTKLKVARARYLIVSKLGEGAMGEVVLAKDTELQRKVALKFVLRDREADETGRKRLLREARAAAALDHPFICKIYDVGEIEGKTFIAMEYLEGQTLNQRLAKGRMEIEEALRIAAEIAEALESAHDKGIVHRDLKPSNIMITPQDHVKVMDFGLAKRLPQADMSASLDDTVSTLMEEGTTAGTLPYMSPEQLRGQEVDSRSDIFSLGIILYEMLAGAHPFQRGTPIETCGAILTQDPQPLFSHLDSCPALLSRMVFKLLRKDPMRRYRGMQHVRSDLTDLFEKISRPGHTAEWPAAPVADIATDGHGKAGAPGTWSRAAWVLALILLGAAASALVIPYLRRETKPPVIRSTIQVAPGGRLSGGYLYEGRGGFAMRPTRTAMALAPDGKAVVYSAIAGNASHLYLRPLDKNEAIVIQGTEGGSCPFFSPRGDWIGFWANGRLKKIKASGGLPVDLCESKQFFGAAWASDGRIVFSPSPRGGLCQVSEAGGQPTALTRPESSEASHRLPHVLPGGQALVFTILDFLLFSTPRVASLNLQDGSSHTVVDNAADSRYAPTGHLVFLRDGTLMAAPFDIGKLFLTGSSVPVLDNVMQSVGIFDGDAATNAGQYGFSSTGSLVYAQGGPYPQTAFSLLWKDRDGGSDIAIPEKNRYWWPRLSPEGDRIAYTTITGRALEGWIYDLRRETATKLTNEGQTWNLIWTPDGKRITFGWAISGPPNIWWQPADGSLAKEKLVASDHMLWVGAWSPDGRWLAYAEANPETAFDLYVMRLEDRRIGFSLRSGLNECDPQFSPDGKRLAYVSEKSGRREVYVVDFPGPGREDKISTAGGWSPLWSRDGSELYYVDDDGQVLAVQIGTHAQITEAPARLLKIDKYRPGGCLANYDAIEGRRFLIMVEGEDAVQQAVTQIILVQNWFDELKRLCPTGK